MLKKIYFVFVTFGFLINFGFSKSTDNVEILNPAVNKCEDRGGEIINIKDENNNTLGVCRFDNDKVCGKWEYYYNDCSYNYEYKDIKYQGYSYQIFQEFFEGKVDGTDSKLAMSIEMIKRTNSLLKEIKDLSKYKLINNTVKKSLIEYRNNYVDKWIQNHLFDKLSKEESRNIDLSNLEIVNKDNIVLLKSIGGLDLNIEFILDWDKDYNLSYYIK